ncbi:MAG: hypothetical protein U0X75_07005 [Acidobacteriota bacterium]
MRRVTRAQINCNVDFIKVNATDRAGQPHSRPAQTAFSEAELTAIVEEARQRFSLLRMRLATGALAAVRAGVRQHRTRHVSQRSYAG